MIDQISDVHQLLLRAIRAGEAPAAVAEWGRAGEIPSRALIGAASLFPQSIDVSPSTWFDLASLTKPLVTTTLTILAFRNGSLQPSTRVGEILLETAGSTVGNLKVEDLLTHTAGLPAWLPLYCVADGKRKNLTRRLAAIEQLAAAGVPVGVMVAPVIPGLTDHEMPAIVKAAVGAGAGHAGSVLLRLPHGLKDLFEDWLERL